MAFTTASEITFINQVMDRLSAAQITLDDQTTPEAKTAFRHWSTTLNSLTRSYAWPFLSTRAELVQIETLTLDSSPTPAAFAVGAVITGGTSATTATILGVTSSTVYDVGYLSGDWTDGETITDDADTPNSRVCAAGYPTTAVATPTYKWTYQYELPTNFSRLISVYEDDGTDPVDCRWSREGHRILTDYSTCSIKYVTTVSDPSDFDPLFAEVAILQLAWKLIPPLAGDMSRINRDQIWRELNAAISKARCVCSQEDNQTGRQTFNLARFAETTPAIYADTNIS
jgi:hypothetical protein